MHPRTLGTIALLALLAAMLGAYLLAGHFPNAHRARLCEMLGVFDDGEILIFGDSITAEIPMALHFGLAPVRNAGRGGELATRSHARLGSLVKERTKHVLIALGTNDLGVGLGPDEIATALGRLAKLARESGAGVTLCSVIGANGPHRAARPPEVLDALNERIRELCLAGGCHFLDLRPALGSPDGGLDPALSRDGLHLNSAGLEILARSVADHLRTVAPGYLGAP